MAMRWFKMQTCIVHDPKLAELTDREFRIWVNCLAIYRRDDELNVRRIGNELHLHFDEKAQRDEAESVVNRLVEVGLLDWVNPDHNDSVTPHDWQDWQGSPNGEGPSTRSKGAERTRRWRERKEGRDVTETPQSDAVTSPSHETSHETKTKTKTETQKRLKRDETSQAAAQPLAARAREGEVAAPLANGRSKWDVLHERLCSAIPAGVFWPVKTNMVVGEIQALIDAGYDLDEHILPVIEARAHTAANAKPPKSIGTWSWFIPAIKENYAKVHSIADGRDEVAKPNPRPGQPGYNPKLDPKTYDRPWRKGDEINSLVPYRFPDNPDDGYALLEAYEADKGGGWPFDKWGADPGDLGCRRFPPEMLALFGWRSAKYMREEDIKAAAREEWLKALRFYMHTSRPTTWPPGFGPRPGAPGCRAPQELIDLVASEPSPVDNPDVDEQGRRIGAPVIRTVGIPSGAGPVA